MDMVAIWGVFRPRWQGKGLKAANIIPLRQNNDLDQQISARIHELHSRPTLLNYLKPDAINEAAWDQRKVKRKELAK